MAEEEEEIDETSDDEDAHHVSIDKVLDADFIDLEDPKLDLFKLLSQHIRCKKFLLWTYGDDDPATGS